ncbi:LTA synthase family protein [Cytobacillus firmus]|uniref:LTA synthase family protein n=1 Tax=Cytobacillus firmus TaxID=1399 RepID=UPI001CFC6AB2|nr:LTA synthase family protein [Cytobacillus firmus]
MPGKLQLKNYVQFIFFTSILLLKFILVRSLLFEDISIFYTVFLEIGYLIVFLGLIEFLPAKMKTPFYLLVNFTISLILLAVLIYHDYFGYIVTIHAFSQLGQVGTIKDSVMQLLNPIYFSLFADFIVLILLALLRKKELLYPRESKNNKLILSILTAGAALVAINVYTQKDAQIANTVLAAEKQGILTYEILAVKEKATAENKPALTAAQQEELPNEIKEIKQISTLPEDELKYTGIAKDKNIIVIQAEAFQVFPLNLKVDGVEITPFLNELIKDSLYFPNVYQQIGPGNTSDAEFIFNTSLYSAPWTATSETFGDRVIPSFTKLLKGEDYKSLTFHANDVSFWSRNNLYPALGFDQYYDISFFGNKDVIGIGPSDEVLYSKALPELMKLHNKDQKFYAQFVTLSSHHPFKIPAGKQPVRLPDRYKGTLVGDYLQAIHYTDKTLQEFVKNLKNEGMWEDTIFVLYGDHFGLQPSGLKEKDYALLKEITGHDYTFLDQFNIPLIISVPGQNAAEVIENPGSQIDMLPTLANLIGLSLENYVHFGQDIVNYPDNLFGMRYYMPYGSFFNNEIAFKPAEGFADGEAFTIQTGEPLGEFSQYQNDYDRIMKLLKLSDDYMNSLPKR